MLKATIYATGETSEDLLLAISQTHRLISEDFTSGHDHNETGAYSFDVVEGDDLEAAAPLSISAAEAQEVHERVGGLVAAVRDGIEIDVADLERVLEITAGVVGGTDG